MVNLSLHPVWGNIHLTVQQICKSSAPSFDATDQLLHYRIICHLILLFKYMNHRLSVRCPLRLDAGIHRPPFL